jgi:REP element-mobilizing transposase RayT
MSLHSYFRVWLHLVWGTIEHRQLISKTAAPKISEYLSQYWVEKGIYMKINFVNPEHVHVLIDLPTDLCIEEAVQLYKGSASHWINQNGLVPGKFGSGRGYGVFSVSHSGVADIANYMASQEQHHRLRSFTSELRLFVQRYGLKWKQEEQDERVNR